MLGLEGQVIGGDGVAPNLLGFANTPGIQVQPYDTTLLDTTRKALTKLELVNIMPSAYVMAPADWETFELLRTADGITIMQGPGQTPPIDRAARRLWGVPVVTSSALSAGTGFLVDFAGSTKLWEREGVTVDWSENVYDSVAGKTDFERNLIRFRAEGRWGFGVLRPSGVVEIDLTP
jgi:HK97 family phage major capsid protein